MTQPIGALRDRHKGRTVSILGRGPSLRNLREVPRGPVIALNTSILALRGIGGGPNYTMQMDGCYPHSVLPADRRPCGDCPTYGMVKPQPFEALIVSADLSPHCFAYFPRRYVFDAVADFGVEGARMSSPMAVRIALLMGAELIVMLCHDAYTQADGRYVEPDGSLVDGAFDSYVQAGEDCDRLAQEAHIPIRWVTPVG